MGKYMLNYRFKVEISTKSKNIYMSFSKISNIAHKLEYDTINEGGVNIAPHYLPIARKSKTSILLERGVMSEKYSLNLLYPGTIIDSIDIYILDENGNNSQQYYYGYNGIITSWEIQPLDAISNNIQIETFEVACDYVRRLRNVNETEGYGTSNLFG